MTAEHAPQPEQAPLTGASPDGQTVGAVPRSPDMANPRVARIGVVTVSDRASRGEYVDRGGPAIREYLEEVLASPWEPVAVVIPDERDVIERALIDLVDRKVSLEKVPTAILSRQTAGIRGSALLVNLPGQPRAIRECLDAVFPAIPYCIDLLEGPRLETREPRMKAYRPPNAKPANP